MNSEDSEILRKNVKKITENIMRTAIESKRDPKSIRLVAVSKTVQAEIIKEAIKAGVTILGESYIQEAIGKINSLSTYPVSWHFIGHLQTKKAKYAVKFFDLIHSVDSIKLALELDREAAKINKVQDILIQVNISGEQTKFGARTDDVLNMVKKISELKNVSIKGLMTMPPFFNDPEKARPYFRKLCQLKDFIGQSIMRQISMNELSMGMSNDYKIAIAEGATLVRIGTALFGERN
jgi:pyridoxal phosphate enzyme (YggS family)